LKFAPIVILAMALPQQHDTRRDILIEPAACSNRSSGAFGTGGAIKTNRLVCHASEPCKNGWTDGDAIWVVGLDGPKESFIRWGSRSPRV